MKKKILYGVELFLDDDGRWKDTAGNVYGYADAADSKDEVVRLGVGWLSLPLAHPLTLAARFHDFAYSSPEYMKAHARSEVDREFLRQCLELAGSSKKLRAEAYALYGIVRSVGWYWWDVRETRWK